MMTVPAIRVAVCDAERELERQPRARRGDFTYGFGRVDAFAAVQAAPDFTTTIALGAAILPGSRAVQVGHTATAFATIVASGTGAATGCAITPTNAPAGRAFFYQQTRAAS